MAKGQAFKLTEEEAKAEYGSKLVVASLGALVDNGAKQAGDLTVRRNATCVSVNKGIRVQDEDRSPAAPDVKRILRQLAGHSVPKFRSRCR